MNKSSIKRELRMYGLVPYNISPIQQGIQYGHSKDEYTLEIIKNLQSGPTFWPSTDDVNNFIEWLSYWKTYIILNGGTTNKSQENLGTLNQHYQTLKDNNIFCTPFYEPDLGDQLTGVTFIVDERVFNKKLYPDFHEWAIENHGDIVDVNMGFLMDPTSDHSFDDEIYKEWVDLIGGEKNIFLRDFLRNFRLA